MKLYFTKAACSLAVRIIINELGVQCEYESVDLKSKQTESGKNYLDINPKGAVPALELDNGEILTENAVIQQYLADTYKATNLLPSVGDLKRYRVLEWLNYVATEMHKGVGILFNDTIPQTVKDQYFKPMISNKLNYLENHFKNTDYIAGNKFTLPDAYMLVVINWLHFFKFNLKDWPNVAKYHKKLLSERAVQQALEQESIVLAA